MARNLPFEEQVRVRAYEIFLERGGSGGSPEEDWRRAEEEVRRQQAAAGPEPVPEDPLEEAETRPGPSAAARPGPDDSAPRRPARNAKSPNANRRSH